MLFCSVVFSCSVLVLTSIPTTLRSRGRALHHGRTQDRAGSALVGPVQAALVFRPSETDNLDILNTDLHALVCKVPMTDG